ncbi:hypothetical protein N8086_01920 [Pelagibacteraceae bacterium]|nr:hypothetical protein [Pelagibacteraceae bacterium]
MTSFSQGKYALAISDRSGMAFPYNEMVKEWNGALVHISEYEPKQPQLQPKPTNADPQALQRARPARTEFATEDFLPNNPFQLSSTYLVPTQTALSVNAANSDLVNGDHVRFRNVKTPLLEADGSVYYKVVELELATTLTNAINATDTLITLDDMPTVTTLGNTWPASGFMIIEKVNSETGMFENEVIEYTGGRRSDNIFNVVARGTSAPYRGVSPEKTNASSHPIGAKVFGSRPVTMVQTTSVNDANTTVTEENSYLVPALAIGMDFVAGTHLAGGGLQCTYGPINDRG